MPRLRRVASLNSKRSRSNAIDPETGEPYLKPVKVELLGEGDEEAIRLPPYLRDAYALAEELCQLLAARVKGSGFLKTLLLRRVGSTIYAGRNTAEDLLGSWQHVAEGEEEDEESLDAETFRSLTSTERAKLQAFVDALEANQERDPKYDVVRDTLVSKGWLNYEVGGKPPNQSGNSSQIFRRTYGYPLQASVDASRFDERTIAVW